jgi:hypothetical protein
MATHAYICPRPASASLNQFMRSTHGSAGSPPGAPPRRSCARQRTRAPPAPAAPAPPPSCSTHTPETKAIRTPHVRSSEAPWRLTPGEEAHLAELARARPRVEAGLLLSPQAAHVEGAVAEAAAHEAAAGLAAQVAVVVVVQLVVVVVVVQLACVRRRRRRRRRGGGRAGGCRASTRGWMGVRLRYRF